MSAAYRKNLHGCRSHMLPATKRCRIAFLAHFLIQFKAKIFDVFEVVFSTVIATSHTFTYIYTYSYMQKKFRVKYLLSDVESLLQTHVQFFTSTHSKWFSSTLAFIVRICYARSTSSRSSRSGAHHTVTSIRCE